MKLNYLSLSLSAIDIKFIELVSLFASSLALLLYNIVIYRSHARRKIFINYFHSYIYSSTSIRLEFNIYLIKLKFFI